MKPSTEHLPTIDGRNIPEERELFLVYTRLISDLATIAYRRGTGVHHHWGRRCHTLCDGGAGQSAMAPLMLSQRCALMMRRSPPALNAHLPFPMASIDTKAGLDMAFSFIPSSFPLQLQALKFWDGPHLLVPFWRRFPDKKIGRRFSCNIMEAFEKYDEYGGKTTT